MEPTNQKLPAPLAPAVPPSRDVGGFFRLVIRPRTLNVTLPIVVLLAGLFSLFGCSKPPASSASPKLVDCPIRLTAQGQLTNDLPDVLAATNIEQWKSLIKNLAKVPDLPNQWVTLDRQRGVDAVVLKSQGQSIFYKTRRISVMVANDAGDILVANICTPMMDIVEIRELGLKLHQMFGFDSKKFDAWCKSVGNEWLDTPVYYDGDNKQNHLLQIRHSFNKQQPWVMHFIIQPEKAHSEFMREFDRQAQMSDLERRRETLRQARKQAH